MATRNRAGQFVSGKTNSEDEELIVLKASAVQAAPNTRVSVSVPMPVDVANGYVFDIEAVSFIPSTEQVAAGSTIGSQEASLTFDEDYSVATPNPVAEIALFKKTMGNVSQTVAAGGPQAGLNTQAHYIAPQNGNFSNGAFSVAARQIYLAVESSSLDSTASCAVLIYGKLRRVDQETLTGLLLAQSFRY